MRGKVIWALTYASILIWACNRGPSSFLTRFKSGGILTVRNHHCRLFMWPGQNLHFAGNVALHMTVWLLLPKNMGLNVLLLQQNRVCNPEKKDGALNLSFAKPLELQVRWSEGLQVAPAALLASRDTYELPSCSCLRARQVHAGEPQRGREGILQPPALGTHQESQVWLAGTEKLAEGQVECHDPSDSFLPLFSSSPPRCQSGLEGGVPGTPQGVWVLRRCCCFAFCAFFCMWICRQLVACCFSNHAWSSSIHRIARVRASVWQLGTTVSLEQRRPVSCRVV